MTMPPIPDDLAGLPPRLIGMIEGLRGDRLGIAEAEREIKLRKERIAHLRARVPEWKRIIAEEVKLQGLPAKRPNGADYR